VSEEADIIEKLRAENALLRHEMGLQRAENALQRDEIRRLRQENKLLGQKVDLLVRKIFGKSSEVLSPDQLELLLGEGKMGTPLGKGDASLEEEADPRPRSATRSKARERWPEDLPVEEQILDPREVAEDPAGWRLIGSEVSEQLDYEPARFLRRRLIRNKYVSRRDGDLAPVIAPLPPSLQERCTAAPGLLAAIITAKYCDHLPLYRQEAILSSRHGVTIPRQSMARWMGLCAELLRPIYDLMRQEILSGGYVQVDETPIRYLSPGHGQTKLGYLWTTCRPRGDVFFRWEVSRGASCLKNVIAGDFNGTIQCDAYGAYPSFVREHPHPITLAGCWAHARRKFHEAKDQAPTQVGLILRQIGHLYRVEAQLRRQKAGPRLREAVRSSQSRVIYERLGRLLTQLKSRGILPRSSLGKAIDYALANFQLLGVYLRDGRVEIDNNQVENSIRPTAIGKKNWLFIGDALAGQNSAILYSLIASCRRRGINPFEYLKDVLTRLPHATNWTVAELTPENWLKNRRTLQLAA
jgi:transposase